MTLRTNNSRRKVYARRMMPSSRFRGIPVKQSPRTLLKWGGGTLRAEHRWFDFDRLSAELSHQFYAGSASDHGPEHWRRVERYGIWLAALTGADELVVRLFAWFHDARRLNEYTDPNHGRRGARLAVAMRGRLFDLEAPAFDRLMYACMWHTEGKQAEDITVGTCWDADRLDLGRVGIIPSAEYMSTEAGRAACQPT